MQFHCLRSMQINSICAAAADGDRPFQHHVMLKPLFRTRPRDRSEHHLMLKWLFRTRPKMACRKPTSKPQKVKLPFEHHVICHVVMLKRQFHLLRRARKDVNASDGEKAVWASCDAQTEIKNNYIKNNVDIAVRRFCACLCRHFGAIPPFQSPLSVLLLV
jgi:hypothetical protein